MADTYQIVRFYQQGNIRRRVIDTRLTLEEAKKHCNDPESSSSTCTEHFTDAYLFGAL